MIHYRSIDDLNTLIKANISGIPKVDAIVGIPRSGMLPASLLALYLGKPLLTLDQLWEGRFLNYTQRPMGKSASGLNVQTVLVVDDSCDSGNALGKVKYDMAKCNEGFNMNILYMAIYVTSQGRKHVDFFLEQVEQPRLFEWNILDHNILTRSCVDLDGILCDDPAPDENDDGEHYIPFLSNARPKFIPHYPIKAIVTCRLEKYRELTEKWLKDNGVKYEKLYMMDYPNAEARRKACNYVHYKADIYKQTGAELFIESDELFAEHIFLATKKPVYCLANNKLFE